MVCPQHCQGMGQGHSWGTADEHDHDQGWVLKPKCTKHLLIISSAQSAWSHGIGKALQDPEVQAAAQHQHCVLQ